MRLETACDFICWAANCAFLKFRYSRSAATLRSKFQKITIFAATSVIANGFLALVLGGSLLLSATTPARAEIPDYILDHDYENCMGGDTADKDRAAYCACVRQGMKGWSLAAYLDAAEQEAAASTGQSNGQPPGMIENLAKQCITQVIH